MNNRLRHCLLNLFKAFIDFCNQHQLTYYAAYGTALGAVRHQGLIPWDDDIDVWMPRKDYQRLLQLRDTLANTPFEIMDIKNKGYYLNFAKFCDKNTTLIEREGQPIMGVYIDIFPLDYYNTKEGKLLQRINGLHRELWFLQNHAHRNYSWHEIYNHLKHGEMRGIECSLHYLFRPFGFIARYGIHKITHTLQAIAPTKQLWYYGIRRCDSIILQACWFENTQTVPFEDFEIVIPAGYDKILTAIYGDYMTLPPKEQQVSRHPFYFKDLNHRLTRKQIIQQMFGNKNK